MKINEYFTAEAMSEIVRTELTYSYDSCRMLSPYDSDDDNTNLLNAFRLIIKYYSTEDQYNEWLFQTQRDG